MYTIRQVAELTGFSPDTLRYYEKIGLVESPRRGSGGVRTYGSDDVRRLTSIQCLKKTGLSLEEMKKFIQDGRCLKKIPSSAWSAEDLRSISSRSALLAEHLSRMEQQRRDLDAIIEETREKLQYYREIMDDAADSETLRGIAK